MFFINLINWFWLFIIPTGIFGFVAYLLYSNSSRNLPYSILISLIGIVLGIVWAERVRKKTGLDNFFGRTKGNSQDLNKDRTNS